jgi:hypothetical protein
LTVARSAIRGAAESCQRKDQTGRREGAENAVYFLRALAHDCLLFVSQVRGYLEQLASQKEDC